MLTFDSLHEQITVKITVTQYYDITNSFQAAFSYAYSDYI